MADAISGPGSNPYDDFITDFIGGNTNPTTDAAGAGEAEGDDDVGDADDEALSAEEALKEAEETVLKLTGQMINAFAPIFRWFFDDIIFPPN